MITAIVLAAGESKRMGQPKMTLNWGKKSVIQTVIGSLQAAGLSDVLVVTGGAREQVEALIGQSAQTIYNENYANGEMLVSIQVGLRAKMREASAALICLGDQPQMQERSAREILQAWNQHKRRIIIPSYQKRRGHPWLIAQELWSEVLALRAPQTMRDFFEKHRGDIFHLAVNTPTILQDLDTPADYEQYKP
ncbi:MAG: hypothetical protein Fur002_04520 [Anaerolineales bacterium]